MGLQVAAEKTEAVRFRSRGEKRKSGGEITVENTRVPLKVTMKYLGLTIQDDWPIRSHLERTALKAEVIMNKLGRLMANKKGPSERKRRLYKNVVNSVILYGCPSVGGRGERVSHYS